MALFFFGVSMGEKAFPLSVRYLNGLLSGRPGCGKETEKRVKMRPESRPGYGFRLPQEKMIEFIYLKNIFLVREISLLHGFSILLH